MLTELQQTLKLFCLRNCKKRKKICCARCLKARKPNQRAGWIYGKALYFPKTHLTEPQGTLKNMKKKRLLFL